MKIMVFQSVQPPPSSTQVTTTSVLCITRVYKRGYIKAFVFLS